MLALANAVPLPAYLSGMHERECTAKQGTVRHSAAQHGNARQGATPHGSAQHWAAPLSKLSRAESSGCVIFVLSDGWV